MIHNGNFICGDFESDCYIHENDAQALLGDVDVVRFYVQCNNCAGYDFLPQHEKEYHLCPMCQISYACDQCRVNCLVSSSSSREEICNENIGNTIDTDYLDSITWYCSDCNMKEESKLKTHDFNMKWNDYCLDT
jgi:hypothetical protein